jgi:hypothetical protein
MIVWAVGCQVGSRTEGKKQEVRGKRKKSLGHKPPASDRPKAVIQFTGGTL